MKIQKTMLLILSAFISVSMLQAQTADDIINKYLDASGGKDKLSSINTVHIENTMSVMGNDAPNTVTIVNGKGFRSESDMMGQKMIQVYTDKGGWMVNPMAGATDPQAMPDEQVKSGQSQIFVNPFLNYTEKGNKAELVGQEKVGDVNAYKIKLTDKNNVSAFFYFDPSTYYLIQIVKSIEMMGQQTDLSIKYSDFKKTDFGWVVPQTMEMNFGSQFSMTSKMNKIEINKDVDMKIFDMPGKQ